VPAIGVSMLIRDPDGHALRLTSAQ